MSHEIQATDGLVLTKVGAWHGMGTIVESAPTPREALTIAGIDWGVEQKTLYSQDAAGNFVAVENFLGNFRADTGAVLGIVSPGYKVVSNAEVADFCEALQLNDVKVRCETAGTIQGGRKMWMLLKGESFDVAHGDTIFPYILVSNSHDGYTPFRITPTTIRVVCSNTLHAVVPRADTGELLSSAFVVRHCLSVPERLEEAKKALQNFNASIMETRKIANTMAAKPVVTADLQAFFAEAYQSQFGEIPTNPGNKVEENRKKRAESAYASFSRRFDDEKVIAGASLWNALNAYTGSIQHDQKGRGADDADRVVSRINSNLFGLNQQRTQAALRLAYGRL